MVLNRIAFRRAVLTTVTTVFLVGSAIADGFTVTRANLAKSATFVVTQTLNPKGGQKYVRVYKIAVKSEEARVDFSDANAGDASYIANKKGLFLYLPGNKTAMKQGVSGGIEAALQQAFAQIGGKLAKAKKVGTAVVSGQPTDIYKDPASGATVYLGKAPGFRLPVKSDQINEGGETSLLVTSIKLNPVLSEALFSIPAGTQIMDSEEGAGSGLQPRIH